MAVGSWILNIFGIRTITQSTIPVPDQPYLELDPGSFSVTPDPGNRRNVVKGAAAIVGSSLTIATPGQVPPQFQLIAVAPTTVTTSTVWLQVLSVPAGRGVKFRAKIAEYIHVPALGLWLWGWTALVVATANGGLGVPSSPSSNPDTVEDFMGSPFDPAGVGPLGSGTSLSIGVNPIDITTPYTGTTMPSGLWAQNKVVTGSVQGSGSNLGLGSNMTILATAAGHVYAYTAGTTSNSGTGPTHTAGHANDGSAVAYYIGEAAAGVPMVVTLTVDEIEQAGIA